MMNRRDFLRHTGLTGMAWLTLPQFLHATAVRTTPAYGLFYDATEVAALQARFAAQPIFAALRAKLSAYDYADARTFLGQIRYNDHLYHIARLLRDAPQLAFQYAMTGEEKAGVLAAEMIRHIMKFPKWDYFLEAGTDVIGLQRAPESAVAVAFCADWLGDMIDAKERAEWIRTMGERGCEPAFRSLYGMRYKDRVVGWSMDETSTYFEHRPGDRVDLSKWPWILDRTNLKAVPASCLTVAALAHEKEFGPSADSERWLEQAVYSVRTFKDLFAPDGSYDEGVSYANYTCIHLAQAAEVLLRHKNMDLRGLINWQGTIHYAREMAMPTTDDASTIVNFGDAGRGLGSATAFWTVRHFRDAEAQWFGETLAYDHDFRSVFWFDENVPSALPPEAPHVWRSDLDWITARTGYTPDDLVVALRSGNPSNHEHADRNSLIVKCFGEVLVADPYRPPYSFSDPAWMMRTTAGHSGLLIDGKPHQYHDGAEGTNASDAKAQLLSWGERTDHMFWTSDATAAYQLVNPDVQSVVRTIVVLHQVPAVLVLDKVVKTATPSRIQTRYFVSNMDGKGTISAEGHQFQTRRPYAMLQGHGYSAATAMAHAALLPVPEETAAKHPFAEIATATASLTPFLLTVLLPERGEGGMARATVEQDGKLWTVSMQYGAQTAQVDVWDEGRLPTFEVT